MFSFFAQRAKIKVQKVRFKQLLDGQKQKRGKGSNPQKALLQFVLQALDSTKLEQRRLFCDWSPSQLLPGPCACALQKNVRKKNPRRDQAPALVAGAMLVAPSLFAIVSQSSVHVNAEAWAPWGYCGLPVEAVPSFNRALGIASLMGIPPLLDTNAIDASRTLDHIRATAGSYLQRLDLTATAVDAAIKLSLHKYAIVFNDKGGFGAIIPSPDMPVWEQPQLRRARAASTAPGSPDEMSYDNIDPRWLMVRPATADFDVGDLVAWSAKQHGVTHDGIVMRTESVQQLTQEIDPADKFAYARHHMSPRQHRQSNMTTRLEIWTSNDTRAWATKKSSSLWPNDDGEYREVCLYDISFDDSREVCSLH